MKNDVVKQKTLSAAKWSSITEIATKIITPIINMILARILAPEMFGILATVTMVISFAEVFVESGFQKYLIQHEFENHDTEEKYTSTAFWANLIFSLIIWSIVIIFQDSIASIAGNEGLGYVLVIAGLMIPLHGIIGIQNCAIKKRLDFKKLFFVRLPAAFVPLFITLPLALLGFGYWSLIIGNIMGVVVRSVLLWFIGKYRPQKCFDIGALKVMLKPGVITMMDGLAIWGTNWMDTLLIASYMSDYQLGLYKNSITMVTTLFSIVTSAITPVLYASLSRLQNDDREFSNMFMTTQKFLCMLILPLGTGVWLYQDLATYVLFGSQWTEAAPIIGITALTLALRTVFVSFNSDAYRAKGKFYIPLVLQIIDLLVLIPTCVVAAKYGFETLVYARAFIRLDLIIPGFILLQLICNVRFTKTLNNLLPSFISSVIMCIVALFLQRLSDSIIWSFISIFLCVVVYGVTICLFRNERLIILGFINKFRRSKV